MTMLVRRAMPRMMAIPDPIGPVVLCVQTGFAGFATSPPHFSHVVNVCEISCGFCSESIYFYNLNKNFDFEGLLSC